ncbi:MAG: DHA2 family efflux MFS transporter permease subunit [Pseudomonadota bacterium]
MPVLSSHARSLWITSSMGILAGLVLLDETMLGVALPSIRSDLALSENGAHWVINAYLLTLTCLAALGGKCLDLFGLRPLLVIGGAVFCTAALFAGFAQSETALVAMRALQGVGAALIFVLSMTGANSAFPPEKRGLAIGIYSAMATISRAAGPLVGGLITHYVSWHWIFWLNIPIVIVFGTIAFIVWRPPSEAKAPESIDGLGLVLLLLGLCGVVYAVMESSSFGWLSPIILISALVGVLCLIAFYRVEHGHKEPLIDVTLFHDPLFSTACFIFMISQFVMISLAVFFPIYLQQVMAFSAAQAGLATLFAFIAFPVIAAPVGRLADGLGSRRMVTIGCFGGAVAMIAVAFLMPYRSYWLMAAPLVIWGICMTFVTGPSRRVAANAAPEDEQGQSTGAVLTLRLFGSTLGVSVSSALIGVGYEIPVVIGFSGGLLVFASLLGLAVLTDDRAPRL